MDHVINAMRPFYDVTLEWYIKEQKEEHYKKFSDNPYWPELKALNDSMNVIRKYLGWDSINLVEEIRFMLGD